MDGERGEDCIESVGFVGKGFEVWDDAAVDGEGFVEGEVLVAME